MKKITFGLTITITLIAGWYLLAQYNKYDNRDTVQHRKITEVINKLYPDIILDYHNVHEDKIIQDFGQPQNKSEATGFIDGTLWSDNHLYYSYSFDNGSIAFYINKETRLSDYVHIVLKKDGDIKIIVPYLINKGPAYQNIILGDSTFGDIFKLMNTDARELKKVISYEGGSSGNSYTNLDFYFGKFGQYHEFTFGVNGLYDEKINNDYKFLTDIKPTEILIN